LQAQDGGALAKVLDFQFTLDRTAPVLDIATPIAGQQHSSTARVTGSIRDSNGIATVASTLNDQDAGVLAVDVQGGFDRLIADNLATGDHQLAVKVSDIAGNSTETQINFSTSNDFLIGTDGTQGWASRSTDSVRLEERDSFVVQTDISVDVGAESQRTLSFDVLPRFDLTDDATAFDDRLLVYLVDPANPTQTLLDRGESGTALFSLDAAGQAEFPPGLVRFNGTRVDIDLTQLLIGQGLLRFQLIGGDDDTGSIVEIANLRNELTLNDNPIPTFASQTLRTDIGPTLDLSTLNPDTSVELVITDVRLDAVSGRFTTGLQVRSTQPLKSRQVAVVFSSLPQSVQILNPSGVDGDGNPYVNFQNVIGPEGLVAGEASPAIQAAFDNADLLRLLATTQVLVGEPNQPPSIGPIAPLTVVVGDTLTVDLVAADANGDRVNFSLRSQSDLPTTTLTANGRLIIRPTPDQIGSFTFDIVASDGAARTTRSVSLNVVADPVTTTRISGRILDTNGNSLEGVRVDVGGVEAFTGTDGSFLLDFGTAPLPADVIRIHGDELNNGSGAFPFVAENLSLLFERDLFEAVNNVIARPIFLPVLDVAGGTTIDPSNDTMVVQEIAPSEMAMLDVTAGTLETREGDMFDGVLSLTEVPRGQTPAALPDNLLPSAVVTIQPAGLAFTTPAPLTLPNRSGFEPGTVMNLWSINPTTGEFDDTGDGVVSADGASIETVSGGAITASWYFFTPLPTIQRNPNGEIANQIQACNSCEARKKSNSEVELHSGALRETHDLVSYQSSGATRGFTLYYNSQRADARPIVNFGLDNANGNLPARFLVARLAFSNGDVTQQAAGFTGGLGLPGGENFWTLPQGVNDVSVALQADLRDLPSGLYDYTLTRGVLRLGNDNRFAGATSDSLGQIVHVNAINSPFGAGWQLGGVEQIVENADGAVLLIDGNGSNLVFGAPANPGDPFNSPMGDFTELIKNLDGSFTRTTTDQAVFQFNAQGRVSTITDRNGNQTEYVYQSSRLTKIIDPVGLETTFAYTGERISQIIDPAGRVTQLQHDANGNLTSITDPDGASRTFEFDAENRLTVEIDQNGNREQTFYGPYGRVSGATRKDGTELEFSPLQTRFLQSATLTADPSTAPEALVATNSNVALSVDANGNVFRTILDQQGQALSGADAIGNLATVRRNTENLVTAAIDGRGNTTLFEFDGRGNVTDIVQRATVSGPLFPGQKIGAGSHPRSVITGDFNGDGITDLVTDDGGGSVFLGHGDGMFQTAQQFAPGLSGGPITTADFNGDGMADLAMVGGFLVDVVTVALGNGDGTFQAVQEVAMVGSSAVSMAAGDFNGDGVTDLATASLFSDEVSVLLGIGDGTFQAEQRFAVGNFPQSVIVGDFNGDGITDLATANGNSRDVSVLLGNEGSPGKGDGTFQAEQRFAVGNFPQSITTGDFNGDGITDLATVNQISDDVSVLLGNEGLPGKGDGTFQAEQRFAVGDDPKSITIGDFNGDGITDLATANRNASDVSVLLGNEGSPGKGNGTFQAEQRFFVGNGPESITIGDFNGDGVTDLAVSSQSFVSVLLGYGNGTFPVEQRFPVDGSPRLVTTGDFNGDGVIDLVTANGGDVSVLLGNTDGTFQAAQRFPASFSESLTVGDFNGDGVTDLVTANGNADTVSVLLGNEGLPGVGDGTFQAEQQFAVGNSPRSVTTGDFNGDGITDLATANLSSDDVSVLIGLGNGTFQTEQRFDVRSGPNSIITGDFNRDGVPDLVTANKFEQTVSVLLGIGNGAFQPEQRFVASFLATSLTVGDFNADNILDLAVGSDRLNSVSVLLGIGNGAFQAEQRFVTGGRSTSVATGDIDGDGVTDLVAASGGNVSVILGNGDGTFQAARQFATFGSQSLAIGDFNNDGATDLVSAGGVFGTVSVLLGFRGVDGTSEPRTFTYDPAFSQLTSSTDELGRQILFEIDPATGNTLSEQRVVGEVDTIGNGETDDLITTFTYTAQGLLDITTDPLGQITDFDYNALGLLTQVTFAVSTLDEATQQFEYDTAGNQTASIDENGNRTEFVYDARNRLIEITESDPDGSGPLNSPITALGYDARGNVLETTDAVGSTTMAEFDPLDRLSLTRDALGNESTFTYDPSGNLSSATNPNGNTTRFTYDSRNRRIETIDPKGGVTTFSYDAADNLLFQTDPNANTTRFGYDARNRLVVEADPLGKQTRFKYDAVDNLVGQTDRNGQVTEFAYDELDRLIAESQRNSDDNTANTTSFTYVCPTELRSHFLPNYGCIDFGA
jgi:YD repeat-containing protein